MVAKVNKSKKEEIDCAGRTFQKNLDISDKVYLYIRKVTIERALGN